MNKTISSGLCAFVAVALAASGTAWANSAPQVNNVTASQRTDGSRLVDIYYDLADADGDACAITVAASDDGGSTWGVLVQTLSVHVGSPPHRGRDPTSPRRGPDLTEMRLRPHRDTDRTSARSGLDLTEIRTRRRPAEAETHCPRQYGSSATHATTATLAVQFGNQKPANREGGQRS